MQFVLKIGSALAERVGHIVSRLREISLDLGDLIVVWGLGKDFSKMAKSRELYRDFRDKMPVSWELQ